MSPRTSALPAALLALAVTAASGAPRPAAAQTAAVFFGPLTTEEAAPLQRLAFTHRTEAADPVGRGVVQAELFMSYANIFEQDSAATHRLLLDAERLGTAAGVRWGAAEGLEVAARLSFETTGGGILDGFVSGWHTRLGLGNGNRDRYPFGAYEQTLRDGEGRVRVDVPRRTLDLEDARVSAKWRAWRRADGSGLVSVLGVARLPARDDPAGERRADVALSALARASWTRWHLHGTVGGATARAANSYDGLVRRGSFFADVAVERILAPSVSGIAQLSVASPRLKGFADPELDGWPVNLVFGAAGRLGGGWRWEVSFQEDIPPNTPAVDFTLGIGIRRSW
jgi:hypothetical protein